MADTPALRQRLTQLSGDGRLFCSSGDHPMGPTLTLDRPAETPWEEPCPLWVRERVAVYTTALSAHHRAAVRELAAELLDLLDSAAAQLLPPIRIPALRLSTVPRYIAAVAKAVECGQMPAREANLLLYAAQTMLAAARLGVSSAPPRPGRAAQIQAAAAVLAYPPPPLVLEHFGGGGRLRPPLSRRPSPQRREVAHF